MRASIGLFLGGLYSGTITSATDAKFDALKGETSVRKFTGYENSSRLLSGHSTFGTVVTIKAYDYAVQFIFFPYDSTAFFRPSTENTWRSWKKITVTDV